MVFEVRVPPFTGSDLASLTNWLRQAAPAINQALESNGGAFYVWNKGCETVPTNTTIAGAAEIVFESPFEGNGTIVLTIFDAEGGVNVALNAVELGSLTGTAMQEVLYEVAVTNLVVGLNSFKIWSTTSDSAELRKIEVYRNFTADQISSSAEWGNITGAGKPADNATANTGDLADLDTVGADEIDNDIVHPTHMESGKLNPVRAVTQSSINNIDSTTWVAVNGASLAVVDNEDHEWTLAVTPTIAGGTGPSDLFLVNFRVKYDGVVVTGADFAFAAQSASPTAKPKITKVIDPGVITNDLAKAFTLEVQVDAASDDPDGSVQSTVFSAIGRFV